LYGYCQSEWETLDADLARLMYDPLTNDSITTFTARGSTGSLGDVALVAYPESRLLHSFGEIYLMATIDEPVTFHNVPVKHDDIDSKDRNNFDLYELEPVAPITVTTPSGIHVTLEPRSDSAEGSFDESGGTLKVSPQPGATNQIDHPEVQADSYYQAPFVRLDHSPLCKKFDRDVQLIALIPNGYNTFRGDVPNPMNEPPLIKGPPPPLTEMKTVTFIIRQRAIVKRYRVSFTFNTHLE